MFTNALKDILKWYYNVRLREVIQNYLGNVLTSKKSRTLVIPLMQDLADRLGSFIPDETAILSIPC
jgi:hypothetical protein